ncbi:MAG: hypothetical protein ACLFUH_08530 [Bacteroidales bacterium]
MQQSYQECFTRIEVNDRYDKLKLILSDIKLNQERNAVYKLYSAFENKLM